MTLIRWSTTLYLVRREYSRCRTTSNAKLVLSCSGVYTVLQPGAWGIQSVPVRTPEVFGSKIDPATVTTWRCATLAIRSPVVAHCWYSYQDGKEHHQ